MATPLVDGMLVEMKVYCAADNQVAVNVRHWVVDNLAGGLVTDAVSATAFNTLLKPLYKAVLNNTAAYRGLTLQILAPVAYATQTVTEAAGDGDVADQPLPRQVCGVVSLRSPFAGRRNHGRFYVPFPSETDSGSSGDPGVGYLSAVDDLASIYSATQVVTDGAASIDFIPCIYHRDTGGTTIITSHVVRTKWGTQRRRSELGRGDQVPPV